MSKRELRSNIRQYEARLGELEAEHEKRAEPIKKKLANLREELMYRETGWKVGNVLRHKDGRVGTVIGVVSFTSGHPEWVIRIDQPNSIETVPSYKASDWKAD